MEMTMATEPRIDDPAALLRQLMRSDFRVFLRKAFASVAGGARLDWNWHLDAIAWELERVAAGRNRNLIVTMPPRNLKSITISVAWVAWMLGQDPRMNFLCVSYSNELALKMARDCLSIIQSHWYRELFPGTVISPRRSAIHDFETTAGGGRLATSVTGTLTGRGGSVIIVDDPIKPQEAYSKVTRDHVNDFFRMTLASRLDDKASGAMILVMQRLHQDDPAGRLLESGGWFELSLPAIAPEAQTVPLGRGRVHHRREGEVLHPSRESLATLESLRARMGSIDFNAQYNQRPVPVDGNVIKGEWLRTYGPAFDHETARGQVVLSWDTASKDGPFSDWSVCIVAHVDRATVRILHVLRARLTFPQLKAAAIRLARTWRAKAMLIEDAASGTQLIQTLRSEQPHGVVPPIAIRPENDKESRLNGATGQIEAGQLLLPEDAPWLAEFRSELLAFPNARHDDQVDALSQLLNWVLRRQGNEPPPCAGPWLYCNGVWTGHNLPEGFNDERSRTLTWDQQMDEYLDAWLR
jgi:predicted phage terminase large subunit-like protein